MRCNLIAGRLVSPQTSRLLVHDTDVSLKIADRLTGRQDMIDLPTARERHATRVSIERRRDRYLSLARPLFDGATKRGPWGSVGGVRGDPWGPPISLAINTLYRRPAVTARTSSLDGAVTTKMNIEQEDVVWYLGDEPFRYIGVTA